MQKSLGQEYLLEKEMATHWSTPAWKIPWTEEPCGLQSMGSQRIGCDWACIHTCMRVHVHTHTHTHRVAISKKQRETGKVIFNYIFYKIFLNYHLNVYALYKIINQIFYLYFYITSLQNPVCILHLKHISIHCSFHFKCLLATHGSWLPYWTVQIKIGNYWERGGEMKKSPAAMGLGVHCQRNVENSCGLYIEIPFNFFKM